MIMLSLRNSEKMGLIFYNQLYVMKEIGNKECWYLTKFGILLLSAD